MSALQIMVAVLGLFAAGYIYYWGRAIARGGQFAWPTPGQLLIGFVTDFLDTLGIGSFAPTTSAFKAGKIVSDERIPGTLNVGHTIPTIVEALVISLFVAVEPMTLIALVLAAVAGAYIGAPIVARWPRRYIQVGMGVALLAAAIFFILKIGHVGPSGHALGLHGGLLWVGIAGNFVLGALMTLGVGLYAPAMVMIGLLGMETKTAWPIMMCSCALLMPVASSRFIKLRAYDLRASLGLALGGVPGVLLAAKIFSNLNVSVVLWLVVVVVIYTAIMMLRSAYVERSQRAVGAGAIVTE